MSQTARYFIAQHVADLFRREPNNIGVFVRIDGNIRAKFFGETEAGTLNASKTRTLPFPGVYEQWVRYWRRTIMQRDADAAWNEIQRTSRDNYQVLDGGILDRMGDDTIDEVVNFLYTALVSEGGIAAALGAPDEAEAAIRLTAAVESDLRKLHLLVKGENLFENVRHPIRRDVPVDGVKATHLLSFVQTNGHPIIMEPIDLTVKRDKRRMEQRAGWASCVFEDILKKVPSTQAIAIVSTTAAEERNESAAYALKLIEPYAETVNWLSDEQRQKFLLERQKVAFAN